MKTHNYCFYSYFDTHKLKTDFGGKIRLMSKKVAIGLSGGVDSATSAQLLLDQGYDVTGFYLSGLYPGSAQEAAIADVRQVAAHLGIEAKIVDASAQSEILRAYFVETYRAGLTPNVCTVCNRELKFGFFFEYALSQGYEAVATGHYARLQKRAGKQFLQTACDERKDQSYFLGLVAEDVWEHVLFPAGGYHKSEIRQIATERGIPVAHKAESMDVCFLQSGRVRDFLQAEIASQPGEIVDGAGKVLGQHRGLQFYTIGQRQGLDIQPTTPQTSVYYVRAKDAASNRLIVGTAAELRQKQIAWKNATARLQAELTLTPDVTQWRARIRHRGELLPVASIASQGETGVVNLAAPAWGVSPGQFVVFYAPAANGDGWLVMGAAQIDEWR